MIPPEVLLLFRIVLALLFYFCCCLFVCFLFVFPNEVENCSFKIYKELCWNFDGDGIESVDCFWYYDHFHYVNPVDP